MTSETVVREEMARLQSGLPLLRGEHSQHRSYSDNCSRGKRKMRQEAETSATWRKIRTKRGREVEVR